MSSLASSYSRYMLARADYMAKQDEFIGLVEMPHRFVGAYFASVRAQIAARFEQLIRPFSILIAAGGEGREEEEAHQAQRISDVYAWLIDEINVNESKCIQSLTSRLKQQSASRRGSVFETGANFYPSPPTTTSSENDCGGDREANISRPFSFDFDKEIESAKTLLLDNQSFVFVESDRNGFGTLFEFKDRYLSAKERLFLDSKEAFTNQSMFTSIKLNPRDKCHFVKAYWIDPIMRIEECIDFIEDSLTKPMIEFRISPSNLQLTTSPEPPEDEEPVQQDSQIKSEPLLPNESRINDDHQQTEPCSSSHAATERDVDESVQSLVQLAENRPTKVTESSSVEKCVVDSQTESESNKRCRSLTSKGKRSGRVVTKSEPIAAAEIETIYLSSDDESESEAKNHAVSLPKCVAKLRKLEASDSDLNENELTAQERKVFETIPSDYKNIAMASNAFALFKSGLVVWANWNKKECNEKYFWPAKIVSKSKHRQFRWTVKFYEAPRGQEEQELERTIDGFNIRLFFTKNHFEFKAEAATARNFEVCYEAALRNLEVSLKRNPIKFDQLEPTDEAMSNNEREAYTAFQPFLSRIKVSEKLPSDFFRPGLIVWANWNPSPMKVRFMWPGKIVDRASHSYWRVQFYQVPESMRRRSTCRGVQTSNIRLFFDESHLSFKERAAKSDNFDCCFQSGLRDLKKFLEKNVRRL